MGIAEGTATARSLCPIFPCASSLDQGIFHGVGALHQLRFFLPYGGRGGGFPTTDGEYTVLNKVLQAAYFAAQRADLIHIVPTVTLENPKALFLYDKIKHRVIE